MHQALIPALFAALAVAAPSTEKRGTDAPNGIKKGLAYNDVNAINALAAQGSATWAYDWSGAPKTSKFQAIPMCWGPGAKCNAATVVSAIKSGKAPYVLGYNEPDEANANGGCATAPGAAWASWKSDTQQFVSAGAKLVCPAITSWDTNAGHTGGPAGFQWLSAFVGAAGNPSNLGCSAQALHWYGTQGKSAADQANAFISYVEQAHTKVDGMFKTTNFPLWITEFAPLPLKDPNMLSDFLKIVIPKLDKLDYVARYSPFMAEYMVSGSSPNVAGNTFIHTS